MKRFISCFMIFVILVLVVSCTEGVQNSDSDNIRIREPEATEYSVKYDGEIGTVFEITTKGKFFAEDNVIDMAGFEDYRHSWQNLIENTFGIEMVIHDTYVEPGNRVHESKTDDYMEYFLKLYETGGIKGLYGVSYMPLIKEMKEKRYILPIDEYIRNSEQWKSIPDDWKNAYAFDGHIWALPYLYRESVTFRKIRSDWLDIVNSDMPATVNEFYEVMQDFTYMDPDGDGENNTNGAEYSGIRSFADIFASFDARLNHLYEAGPVWNPNENLWEDSVLKPGFTDCMNFLLGCSQETIISRSKSGRSNSSFVNGRTGSYYAFSETYDYMLARSDLMENFPDNDEIKVDFIPGLAHYISENITGYFTDYRVSLVLTANSTDPASTINIFIENFIGDYNGFILAKFGNQHPYVIRDGLAVADLQHGEEYYPGPRIVSDNPLYYHVEIKKSGNDNTYEDRLDHYRRIELARDNKLCYKIPNEIIQNKVILEKETVIKGMTNAASNIFSQAMNGFISVDEGIEQYKSNAAKYGMQEYLDDLNYLLGKTSDQHY